MAEPQSPHLTTHSSGEPVAIQRVTPNEPVAITVTSPGVDPEGRLGDVYSGYHDNISPALSWTMKPEADAYALIVQDPDAPRPDPVLHWMIWNIPGTADGLPQQVASGPSPANVPGAVQGANYKGEHAYAGPRPPQGHGVHRYHFQLFALDSRLPDDPDTPLGEILNMLKGHTLAVGELIAAYERPDIDAPGRTGGYR